MLIVLWISFCGTTSGLNVFHSTTRIPETGLSGIHFKDQPKSVHFSNDLSACAIFNFKRFHPNRAARVFDFDTRNDTLENDWSFLWFSANYPGTWFGFGNYGKAHAYSGYILREPPDDYDIWSTNMWHHICLSFSKPSSFLSVVKVNAICT